MAVGMICHATLILFLAAGADPDPADGGNGLCWYNSDRSYERCCGPTADPDCWVGIWVTADLCCHPMTAQQQECFDSMESRVESKLKRLHDMTSAAEQATWFFRHVWHMFTCHL